MDVSPGAVRGPAYLPETARDEARLAVDGKEKQAPYA